MTENVFSWSNAGNSESRNPGVTSTSLFSSRSRSPPDARMPSLTAAENPPFGAVFTYNVAADLPADAKLVLTITDATGRQVRRLDLEKTAGLRRLAWNLRGDPPAAATAGRGGEPGTADDEQQAGDQAQAGQAQTPPAGRGGAQTAAPAAGQFAFGRGGAQGQLRLRGFIAADFEILRGDNLQCGQR